jgi:hypothetical protein
LLEEGKIMRFLSAEWLELRMAKSAGFVVAEDVDLRIQRVVTGGPDDIEIRFFDEFKGGRLSRSGIGDVDDPDLTITSTWPDEVGLLSGDIDPYVAVVEGQVRVEGDHGLLLMLLPMLQHYSTEIYDTARYLLDCIDE